MLGFSVWLILFGATSELGKIAKYFPKMLKEIWQLEIGLIEYSQAIRNWSRQNCRPWTPRKEENQAPFGRNPVTRGNPGVCKKITGLRRAMRTLRKKPRLPEKKVEQLKKSLENLKREAWGLSFCWFIFSPCLFICYKSDFGAISKISCKYSLCDCTWITLISLNICLVIPKYICCLH